MKNLYETILDDEDSMINDESYAEEQIKKWIFENYTIENKNIEYGKAGGTLSYEEFLNVVNINKNNVVDIDASLTLKHSNKTLTNGSFSFGKIGGYFDAFSWELTTLKGGPTEVARFYSLNECTKLKNLKYLATKIGSNMPQDGLDVTLCNALSDFTSMPKNIVINGSVWANALKKLKNTNGLPEVINGDLYLEDNKKLTDVSNLKEIKGTLYIYGSYGLDFYDFSNLKVQKIDTVTDI